ncbi:protein-tyrosine-phosphatase MKP1-like [Chenopodium quinoa]|uniref:MAP kinase phosphatase 1 n=1 Tax=Chenopodium quinoa TaxID=63459 RepID=A0A803L0W8_CHEQI|nr:protein-tyrosine-phosphatase MKP1-like [Chenopodium quinoa]
MLGAGDEEGQANARRTYLRSVSWSDRSPNKPNPVYPRAQPSNKARSCLPPLQPLSISRRIVEWPKAGSDDLGVWPLPTTPGGRIGSGLGVNSSGSSKIEVTGREFESNKDKLAFYEKECSRIVEHIYLGSEAVAKNREVLRQNGITHVLNCVGFVCPEFFKGDLVYKTLWLQDRPSEDITSILYDVFDYFEDVREQSGRVLVHCCQGVSRSTSLVIAYLMWKEGQSFEDAFQYVKAARGVTNPNMGFACQLLQCQKRVHAMPISPNSILRMYRMAPHSPYAPLHLVPKLVRHPSKRSLDSRGAFIVHVPSAIYVWIGRYCSSMMSNNARKAAQQVIKYERAQGPLLPIKEGEEPSEFWDTLSSGEILKDGTEVIESIEGGTLCSGIVDEDMANSDVSNRKVDEYDQDFEIFNKALAGGVVPPFTLSSSVSETHLPARENGWGRLRKKFANGILKGFFLSPIACQNTPPVLESGTDSQHIGEEPVSPTAYLLQSTLKHSLSESILPNTDCISEGFEQHAHHADSSFPLPSPCSSPDSFSPYPNNSPPFNSMSPSLSPSTSDYSSPFTFSPSSSNWSDSSNLSSQPSPSGLELSDHLCTRNSASGETDCLFKEGDTRSCVDAFSAINGWKSSNFCSSCKGTSPSIAERRGSNPPTLMLLATADSAPAHVSSTLVRSWSFSLPNLGEEIKCENHYEPKHGEVSEVCTDDLMLDADQ